MTIQRKAWIAKTGETGTLSTYRHVMDVASVAQHLAKNTGLVREPGQDATLALLAGLHDLGKLSSSFQASISAGSAQADPHWQLTPVILEICDDLFAGILPGAPERRRHLYDVVGGHHGEPVEESDRRSLRRRKALFDAADVAEARRIILALIAVTRPASIDLDALSDEDMSVLGWRLAGLTTQADWIASNEEWFTFGAEAPDALDDWNRARERAEIAIRLAGLGCARIRPDTCVLGDRKPTPMQQAAIDAPLPAGNCMVLIEDATGAGKTEAGFILASRFILERRSRGIFFGLPTMATSNALLERAETIVPKIFDGHPMLALTHGRARHDERFLRLRFARGKGDGAPSCSAWISSGSRKVLFADVGVGTIDQALMAVLPTRFSALRLHALSDKVLIVDEAHSYDPYMEAALCRLLTYHARMGGSAIVMSATLPAGMRRRLIEAWQIGTGCTAGISDCNAYPAMTVVGEGIAVHPVDPAPWTVRKVPVRRFNTLDHAIDRIATASRSGAASIWIRNSVRDAMEARQMLAAEGIPADLLHSRFALCDRLERESRLIARFGPDGRGREGGVIVATQVVEQSLNIDFDVMVTDLCPIGALIQRMGRLWRHERIDRPEASPVIDIISPDPRGRIEEWWLNGFQPTGRFVYSHDAQWRTAAAVFGAGRVTAPEGLRDLIEAVHGRDPEQLPETLLRKARDAEGDIALQRARAGQYLIRPGGRYDAMTLAGLQDEERASTRLGKPQVTLALARPGDGGLRSWAGGVEARDWALSEVQISESAWRQTGGVDQASREVLAVKADWPVWKQENTIIAPVHPDGFISRDLRYDTELGLQTVSAED
ncbi:CRISPR-associated helicase Cas3' [Paracoccus litorisediminis]|uniref:CRISPR-associated helicase Cas3' n=1 Tax=Paracoccus litorisediminis TaxID=2006130 RepID=UPI00373339FF